MSRTARALVAAVAAGLLLVLSAPGALALATGEKWPKATATAGRNWGSVPLGLDAGATWSARPAGPDAATVDLVLLGTALTGLALAVRRGAGLRRGRLRRAAAGSSSRARRR